MINIKYSFVLVITLLSAACSKKADNNKDTTAPAITIISPQNNQLFNAGDAIEITATATDNDKVTELHIQCHQ